ncbi:hypothetical protein V6N13_040222 [Hibiscus sabdariffa]|uniref:Uncharacterized protein n=1 Tax=Hibiscus sabdariffa TaxID=183260 RepID=A0ABR2STF9_9ROSI
MGIGEFQFRWERERSSSIPSRTTREVETQTIQSGTRGAKAKAREWEPTSSNGWRAKNGHHCGAASPTSRHMGWKLAKHANVVEGMGSGRTLEQESATGEAARVSIRDANGMRRGRQTEWER